MAELNCKNILIIYTDQLKREFLSCYGATEIETPYIDSIARNGVTLENFYTPSAVCTPSRGCFMTGCYPFCNGAFRNGEQVNMHQKGFADAFREAGYRTGYVGKWHLGPYGAENGDLSNCNHLGFDDWKYQVEFGHCKMVSEQNGKLILSHENGDAVSYTTDWLADQTIAFIKKQNGDKPFLFMVSMPDPHQPFKVRAPYDTMFNPYKLAIPESFYQKELPDWAQNDEWGRKHYFPLNLFERESHFRRLKAQYLGEIKCIDDNVGRILAALQKKGLGRDTIVIFTTDHGDYMGEHGLLEKNNLYDSVYHLPMLISMPGTIRPGTKVDGFINVVDFPTTLASLAGVEYPYPTNGANRCSLLLGKAEDGAGEIYIHPSDVPRAGIITREFELAYVGHGWNTNHVFHDHILFDRIHDPKQLQNLFHNPDYADVVRILTKKIRLHHQMLGTPNEYLPQEVQSRKNEVPN